MTTSKVGMAEAKRRAVIAIALGTAFLGGVAAGRAVPLRLSLLVAIGIMLIWCVEAGVIAIRARLRTQQEPTDGQE